MLQSLLALSDQDVTLVVDTVRKWCEMRHLEIDSSEGRLAMTVVLDLVPSQGNSEALLRALSDKLN